MTKTSKYELGMIKALGNMINSLAIKLAEHYNLTFETTTLGELPPYEQSLKLGVRIYCLAQKLDAYKVDTDLFERTMESLPNKHAMECVDKLAEHDFDMEDFINQCKWVYYG